MKNYKIIFTAPKIAEVLQDDAPTPNSDQVLVKTMCSTVSGGTERANLIGDENLSWHDKPREATYPRNTGYSSSGIIEAVGSNVKDYTVGDRVALSWCPHSRYCVADASKIHKIEDPSITFSEAALCHIGTFPLGAIRKCHLEIGESAIVMGLGILGILGVLQLKAAGAAPIIAVDPVKEKRELALKLGADHAFDPFDKDFSDRVKSVTNGGVKVALEVTGNGTALDQVLDCMARFGRVALLGCTRDSNFQIDYYRKVHGPGIVLYGAHTMARPDHESSSGLWTTHDDVMAQLKLLSLGRLNYRQIIDETHSPMDAPTVYTRLANENSFPVTQFDWSAVE